MNNGPMPDVIYPAHTHRYTICCFHSKEVVKASLVPRPPPSSVRNARAQFNAGVEKRREKAWTNFTRDPRHRRHKCLTRNSVTYPC